MCIVCCCCSVFLLPPFPAPSPSQRRSLLRWMAVILQPPVVLMREEERRTAGFWSSGRGFLFIPRRPPLLSSSLPRTSPPTAIEVESANKHGSLLEVAQILTDFNLTINRAYISSDGQWFMDVFHVTDQEGNKIINDDVISRINI